MGVHNLVIGLNGQGKTLYAVATKLRPMAEATFKHQGREVKRRLVVGGLPQLALPHELMEVPELDPETWKDEWREHRRDPGQPPVEGVVCSILNWWLWCMPGDYIVVDECQRVFRPMASGRRVPMFISKLETARHYGVEFLYIAPHAPLIHANVRALCGPVELVARAFGSSRALISQWDRVGDVGKKALATTRIWKHDKSAFALYQSAQMHHKFGQRLPLAVWAMVGGVVLLAAVAWALKGRMSDRFSAPAAAASAPAVVVQPGRPTASAVPGQSVVKAYPVLEAEPVRAKREPFAGRGLQLEGVYTVGGEVRGFFGVVVDGQRVATVTLAQLVRAGYAFVDVAPCAALLRFEDTERVITCAPRGAVAVAPAKGPESTAPAAPGEPAT